MGTPCVLINLGKVKAFISLNFCLGDLKRSSCLTVIHKMLPIYHKLLSPHHSVGSFILNFKPNFPTRSESVSQRRKWTSNLTGHPSPKSHALKWGSEFHINIFYFLRKTCPLHNSQWEHGNIKAADWSSRLLKALENSW